MRLTCLAIAILVLCIVPALAFACQCVTPSLANAAKHANVVFFGTISAVHELKTCEPNHPTRCSTGVVGYDVTVEGVFKGKVGATAKLDPNGGGSTCAPGSLGKNVKGTRWLVFTSSTQEPFSLHICSGTQRVTAKAIAALTKQLGTSKTP
jgi:hypothetical protein